jgi:thiamine-monophosphate kinase
MAWSEEELLRWLERRFQRKGDDAVFLPRRPEGREVVCVDQVIEGVHFTPKAPPARIGAKAAARSLSDLAASAARPHALLCALRAPATKSAAWMRAVLAAVDREGRRFGAPLEGGDLACAPGPASLAVSALGLFDGRRAPPTRSGARAGHWLVATGPFGGSVLGRHLWIEPRVELGRWLFARGASALIDVSDGLARDAWRMGKASGLGVRLEVIPEHADAARAARRDGRSTRWHALHDGEDHELLAALAPAAARRALKERPELVHLGWFTAGSGLWIEGERWDGRGGFVHGA